jgi:peptidoglycan/xylan/chitin deacetylase (PgdA/CDA1 family)
LADTRRAVIRAGLESLYFSGIHRLARQFVAGMGAILTFHRVRPADSAAFQPNRALEITPEFLEEVVVALRAANVDLVSLDEVHRRLMAGSECRRFVALTFDDGYRDNRDHAWPILKRHGAPFGLYVASGLADGRGELWWVALEEAIARHDRIAVGIDGTRRVFDCSTLEAKRASFGALYSHLRGSSTEAQLRALIREIAARYDVDLDRQCRELCMGWTELAEIAADPLATIGAHTVSHPILSKLSEAEVRAEMLDGAAAIAAKLGRRPEHFAYPVGQPDAAGPREFALAQEAGFKTAVTTRPGVLFPDHADHLTALPRISVNGEFQRRRYLDVLLSGAPTALKNGFRRVDAA